MEEQTTFNNDSLDNLVDKGGITENVVYCEN